MRPSYTFWLWFWLAIIGIVLFYPKFRSNDKARIRGPWPDLSGGGINVALDWFEVDHGFYPKSLEDLLQQPSGTTNWHGPYLDPPKLPVDPWGKKYLYDCPGKHNTNGYDLSSAGPDGKPGTDDDIVSWTN